MELHDVAAGVAVVLLICAAAFGQSAPDLKDPERISAGRKLFQEKHCTYCHGGDANGPIKLAGRDDLTPDGVFGTISDGKVTGNLRMPSWRGVLSDEQIWQATAYVLSLAQQPK